MTGTMPRIPLDRRLALLIAWVALPSASKGTLARAFDISGMTVSLAAADLTREGLVENLYRLEAMWRVRAKDFTASGWAKALFRAIGIAGVAVIGIANSTATISQSETLAHAAEDAEFFAELDAMPVEEARSRIIGWAREAEIYTNLINRLVAFANFQTKAIQALSAFDHPRKRKAA